MITAQFPGECTSCGYDIAPGQQIETDDADGWQHVVCVEEMTEEQVAAVEATPCPFCFLIHAGECF